MTNEYDLSAQSVWNFLVIEKYASLKYRTKPKTFQLLSNILAKYRCYPKIFKIKLINGMKPFINKAEKFCHELPCSSWTDKFKQYKTVLYRPPNVQSVLESVDEVDIRCFKSHFVIWLYSISSTREKNTCVVLCCKNIQCKWKGSASVILKSE